MGANIFHFFVSELNLAALFDWDLKLDAMIVMYLNLAALVDRDLSAALILGTKIMSLDCKGPKSCALILRDLIFSSLIKKKIKSCFLGC